MSGTRVFTWGFLAGFAAVLAGAAALPAAPPSVHAAIQFLATPGVILSLPVINLVPSPVWAVGCIAVLNGVVYGTAAALVLRGRGRRGRDKGRGVPTLRRKR